MNATPERPAFVIVARNQVRPTSSTTAMGGEGLGTGRVRVECGWSKIVAGVEAMRNLADDWDGEGAKAPSSGAIDTARELMRLLRADRFPCPTTSGAGPNGSVLLAWESGKRYFEINITAPDQAEWFRSAPYAPATGGSTMYHSILALDEWVRV